MKTIKKLIIVAFFAVSILMITKVEAFTVTNSSNIVDHHFTPYAADPNAPWIFYCIHHGAYYKANLPEGYEKDQILGEWCVTCGTRPTIPTLDGETNWNVTTMEYTSVGKVDDRAYQDAAYVIASAQEAGKITDMGTQYSIWDTMLNLGYKDEDKGIWGQEAEEYLKFYNSIHNNAEDLYESFIADNTDIDSVKVQVDQTNKTYIMGPFKIQYPKGEYEKQKWSYIKEIHLLNQENNELGKVTDNTIHIININGEELRDTINNNNFPNSNEEFYVKFSSTLGDITHAKLKVDFEYLESCSATLEKFNGVRSKWVWVEEDTGRECNNPNHEEDDDTTIKRLRLKVEEDGESQELVAFKCDDEVHGYGGHSSKNYKNVSLIVGVKNRRGIDLTMKLAGQVFLDQDTGKVNTGDNKINGNNEALNGVEVILYDTDGNVETRAFNIITYTEHKEIYSHIHSGDSQTGGGCYNIKNPEHENHIGSWEKDKGGEGTCYTIPIKHEHKGNPAGRIIGGIQTHKHDESCYSICGGQLYTAFGNHYVHTCRKCGYQVSNYTLAGEEAQPGTDCNKHYDGKCSQKILTCGKAQNNTETLEGYGCYTKPVIEDGKIVRFELNCGLNENDVVAWGLSCNEPLYIQNCNQETVTATTWIESGTTETIELQNPVITKTVKDEKGNDKSGYYEFSGLDAMKNYYVKFIYNGMLYTNVKLEEAFNTDNGSKADETTRYNYRLPLNAQFKEIGSYPSNYQIKTKVFGNDIGDYNEVYLQEDILEIFKTITKNMEDTRTDNHILACQKTFDILKNNNEYKDDLTQLKRKIQFAADCRISSTTTRNYPLTDKFTIGDIGERIDNDWYPPIYSGTYNQLHINLGIKARPTFDLALYKDVLKAEVKINGKTETYNYDSRKQSSTFKIGISEQDYLNGLRGAYQSSYPYVNALKTGGMETDSYELNMRTEEVANGQSSNYNSNVTGKINGNYQINGNYDNLKQDGENKEDRLKVYVTYKIAIKNQSGVTGAVTEIVDYFDSNYKFVESYVGDANGIKTGDVTKYDTTKYQANTQYKSNNGAYTTVYLRPSQETRLGANEEQYIYVKLELLGQVNDAGTLLSGKLLNNQTLNTINLAEINGYKTYNEKTGESTPGLIDIDSNPGNLNISDITELTQENLVGYPNIRQMYEDDTSRAPVLIFGIYESRTIEGIVFEDETGKNDEIYTKEERKGDGKLDEKENIRVQGVKVELVEVKNDKQIVRAQTITNKDGWYGFTGFIPGNYQIKYTYGHNNETAMAKSSLIQGQNEKSYNGQDYQSTAYQEKVGGYWYKEDLKLQAMSDAKDTNESINRVINYSRNTDNVEITNHKAEVFNSYINPQLFNVTPNINESLVEELKNNTYREAYTPLIEVEVEYATKSVTGNKKYTHKIEGIDFGIVERAKSELVIDQDVEHIKVTLADGQVLINTKTGENNVDNVQWVKDGNVWVKGLLGKALTKKWENLDMYDKKEVVNIIMDDELLNGAQIEIIYKLTVTNNGEEDGSTTRAKQILNYVANNLNFDANDNNGLWETVVNNNIQNSSKSTLVNNTVVDLSTQSVILKATSNNPLTKALKPGEQASTELVLKKVLSAENYNDDLRYTNMTEIVEIENTLGRYDHGAIPGNQKLDMQPQEHDTSGASRYVAYDENGNIDNEHPQDGTIIITPPTGSNYIYYTIGIVGALILIIGIFLIKKYVLNNRN